MIPRDFGSMDEVPFSADDVLQECLSSDGRGAHQILVSVEGRDDSLRFYRAEAGIEKRSPLVFLEGDVVHLTSPYGEPPLWHVAAFYQKLTPNLMQGEVNFYAASAGRTLINLARPGIFGSTGRYLERQRPREVALVDPALDALKARFGWKSFDLAGFSGCGHLVGALLARRDDIGCAIIASGNVAVRQRGTALGLTTDVTGYADFIDPIDYASEIARRQPKRVIMLTDPMDRIVEARFQTAFGAASTDAGVNVEQRMIAAADTDRHNLRHAAIIAGLACRTDE